MLRERAGRAKSVQGNECAGLSCLSRDRTRDLSERGERERAQAGILIC